MANSQRTAGRRTTEQGGGWVADADDQDLSGLHGPIAESVEEVRRLARIEWERGKSALRSHRPLPLLGLWEAMFLATLAVAGALVFVRGLTGAFGRLFGAEWAGDFLAGSTILAGAIAIAVLSTAHQKRGHPPASDERSGSNS